MAGTPMRGGGGVSGEIAAISGSTLQVQDSESQTAVSYTDTTTITRTVAAALADVTAGVCVTAFTGGAVALDATDGAGVPGATGDAGSAGGSTGSSGSGSDGSSGGSAATDGTSDSTGEGTGAAASVTISDAVDGECAVGAFGADGAPPEGLPVSPDGSDATNVTPPTDAPDGLGPDGVRPTGVPGDGADGATGALPAGPGGFGGLSAGLVTAVTAAGFTVQSTAADGTTSTEDVTVDDSTTFTRTESADASALVVGACVTAMGEADEKGAVVATALAVAAAGDDGCSAAVTLRGPGGGQRPAQPGTTTGSGS
jgi:hypothetical protein